MINRFLFDLFSYFELKNYFHSRLCTKNYQEVCRNQNQRAVAAAQLRAEPLPGPDHATFNDGGICQHKNILFCNCLESFHKNTNALKNLSRNDSKSIYIPILFYSYPSSKHNNISELWYRQHTAMKKRKKQNPDSAPSPGKVGKRSARLSASAQDSEGDGGVHFTPPLAANIRTSAVNEISQ